MKDQRHYTGKETWPLWKCLLKASLKKFEFFFEIIYF